MCSTSLEPSPLSSLNLCIIAQQLSFIPPPVMVTTIPLSVSVNVAALDTSYMWSHWSFCDRLFLDSKYEDF